MTEQQRPGTDNDKELEPAPPKLDPDVIGDLEPDDGGDAVRGGCHCSVHCATAATEQTD